MAERMTREQINKTYPNQYVALRNPVYVYGTLDSAEVAYTDSNGLMLWLRQVMEQGIVIWYTGDNPPVFMDMMFLF
ncbi:MAG: hypothetical protein K2K96_06755 [Lachnospiraceae bacterium]|nr:hypothetical protein [Lachnospiraceae bacterium]